MELASQQVTHLAKRYLARQTKPHVGDIHIRINHQLERFLRAAEPYKYILDTIRLVTDANHWTKGRIICTSREHAIAILLSRDAVENSRFTAPAVLQPLPTLAESKAENGVTGFEKMFTEVNSLRVVEHTGRKFR